MTRYFYPLAATALLMMGATLVLGLTLRGLDIRDPSDRAAQAWASIHRQAGILTGVGVLLVHSIVVTYFIGTSKWCREVTETYRLAPAAAEQSTALKRRTFPLALMSMLVVVGVAALGAASDPAAALAPRPFGQLAGLDISWAEVHLLGALLGIGLIGYAFLVEAANIRANQQAIQAILADVRRIRAERGLDAEPPAAS